jgi:hypothetical protein
MIKGDLIKKYILYFTINTFYSGNWNLQLFGHLCSQMSTVCIETHHRLEHFLKWINNIITQNVTHDKEMSLF